MTQIAPLPPLVPAQAYVDPKTGKFTATGFRQLANMQAQIGVTTTAGAAPTEPMIPGTTVFVPATGALHIYDGAKWKSVILT